MNRAAPVVNEIRRLDWDSQFFGLSMGRLYAENLTDEQLEAALTNARAGKLKFVEIFCDISDGQSIFFSESRGFHLADIRILFEKNLKEDMEHISLPANLDFKKAGEEDIDHLKTISKGLFRDSRYYQYNKFDSKIVDSLYQTWIEKAVLGKFDDECYCLFNNKKILAFCSLKYNNHAASIGLFAVNSSYNKKGFGSLILKSVFHLLTNRGITLLTCITQGRNSGAMRLYQKHGFYTGKIILCYYRWLE